LKEISEKIKKEKSIWVSSEKPLLQEKVSAQFEDLSFSKGLKRTLNAMNYGIIYNKEATGFGSVFSEWIRRPGAACEINIAVFPAVFFIFFIIWLNNNLL